MIVLWHRVNSYNSSAHVKTADAGLNNALYLRPKSIVLAMAFSADATVDDQWGSKKG